MKQVDLMIDCKKMGSVEIISSNEMRVELLDIDVSELAEDKEFLGKLLEKVEPSDLVEKLTTKEILDQLDVDEVIEYLRKEGYEVDGE